MKKSSNRQRRHLDTEKSRRNYSAQKNRDFESAGLRDYGLKPTADSPPYKSSFDDRPGRAKRTAKKVMTMKERAAYSEGIRTTDPITKLMQYQDKSSSIPKNEIDLEYLPELAPVEACLGVDLSRSVLQGDFYQSQPLHNLEFTLYVALRALEFLNENDRRWAAWSGKPPGSFSSIEDEETENRYWRLTWMRTAFRCIVCMPVGYIISQVKFQGPERGAPSWSPANEDMADYIEKWGSPKVTKTDFLIDPRETSLLTYTRLFGDRRGNIPMLAQAEADFFSDKPNRQNPIWRAYHRALSHVLAGRRFLPLPYWWAYAVNHEYIADPDFVPLRVELQCLDGFTLNPKRESDQETPTQNADAQPTVEPPNNRPEIPSLVQNACEVVHQRFAAKDFTANGGGCVFQGISGRVNLVVPWFWDKLSNYIGNPSLTPELLYKAFAEAGLLDDGLNTLEQHFAIVKAETGRRLGKCRTLPLSTLGQELLFPNGVPFGNNPDLKPIEGRSQASAA